MTAKRREWFWRTPSGVGVPVVVQELAAGRWRITRGPREICIVASRAIAETVAAEIITAPKGAELRARRFRENTG